MGGLGCFGCFLLEASIGKRPAKCRIVDHHGLLNFGVIPFLTHNHVEVLCKLVCAAVVFKQRHHWNRSWHNSLAAQFTLGHVFFFSFFSSRCIFVGTSSAGRNKGYGSRLNHQELDRGFYCAILGFPHFGHPQPFKRRFLGAPEDKFDAMMAALDKEVPKAVQRKLNHVIVVDRSFEVFSRSDSIWGKGPPQNGLPWFSGTKD